MEETRIFEPPEDLAENCNAAQWMKKKGFKTEAEMRKWTQDNYVEFWDEMAKTYADWYEPYTKVLDDSGAPYYKWFSGGKVNMFYNAIERHVKAGKGDKVAYYFVPEPTDQPTKTYTYNDLYETVNKLANGLKSMGVVKGDRVSIYMPMLPETVIAMLACAKIGAIHSLVFSGFSSKGFGDRVTDCEAKVVFTSDGFYRRGQPRLLKPQTDEGVKDASTVKKVIVLKRTGLEIPWTEGRDVWFHDVIESNSADCETEKMDPEDRLFILYTSGTTGKPKGIEHVHGGYCVTPAQTLSWVFDLKEDDIWWCTADVGWITGHSYVAYGPLCLGVTSVMYEGSPDYPDFGRWFKIIQDYKISVLYTAPTAVRMLMKQGNEWPEKYDLSSIRLLGSVGEPLNPEAYIWYRKYFGNDRSPIMDTWWQTESGCFVISPLPMTPCKPGSVAFPLPGMNTTVYDESGEEVPLGAGGNIVNKTPWPSMLRAFYKDEIRYKKEYWNMYWDIKPGTFLAGDKATRDKDGYWFIQGRIDDVLSVAGHRIANAEVESALVAHKNVAEAAVVGKPDPIKGEAIIAFVTLNTGTEESDDLKKELRTWVRTSLGPLAIPAAVYFVDDVPKTRSGKIMRRIVKSKALGNPVGDTSALANPEAVDNIPLIV
ncbi:MAG: acetate--CoA ligase [Methanotrichaceae archaeon]